MDLRKQSSFKDTHDTFLQELDSRMFFRSKMLEMRQRHQKYGDTPYALEPNIKEGLGGLRDLQVFLWYAKAAGYGTSWKEMAQAGLITGQRPITSRSARTFCENCASACTSSAAVMKTV